MDLVISTGFANKNGNNSTYVDTTTNNAAGRAIISLTFCDNASIPARVANASELHKNNKY